eukprot:CAMPEP_0172663758 /NCGR_PEP_ID=MMETSP1074-20121228/6142_1 /TAXON_ID=2916 /ORGANISM="Ceratium fusus, Strain PA161109" /LENGTH=127 /DNA_ID=CAMNT_0013479803 /DNA_START=514 /DNA_END=898 /DNA_ORIENTATION=+
MTTLNDKRLCIAEVIIGALPEDDLDISSAVRPLASRPPSKTHRGSGCGVETHSEESSSASVAGVEPCPATATDGRSSAYADRSGLSISRHFGPPSGFTLTTAGPSGSNSTEAVSCPSAALMGGCVSL